MSSSDPHDDGRSYLAAFRTEHPGEDARRRNWQALQRRLDVAASPSEVLEGTASRGRLAMSVGLSLAIAAAILLLLRGLGGGIVAMKERRTPGMEAVDQAAPAAPRLTTPARSVTSPSSTSPRVPAVAPSAPSAETTPPSPAPPRAPALRPSSADSETASEPPATTTEVETATTDDLAAETRMLAEARRALSEGRPAAALEVLERHARRFPEGALQEERRAYQAVARCGRSPSQDVAEQFLSRYPSSPHAARVRAACGSPP